MRLRIMPAIFALVGWTLVSPGFGQPPADEDCASCHADQAQKIQASAHANVGCPTCHVRHETYPHPAGIPKPQCAQCHAAVVREHAASVHGQALKNGNEGAPTCAVCHGDPHELKDTRSESFHQSIPDTCGMCHGEIADQYKASVHGQAVARGIPEAPVCTNCHGEHKILAPTSPASTVNPLHIPETCGQCHGNVQLSRRFGLPLDRIVSFDASFHGLATKAGSESVANCASCHGVHNILPSSDPRSTINVKNLPRTCGRCHPGAGTRFAIGTVHELPGRTEPPAVRLIRLGYAILIPLTLGLMLLHNAGDWVRKLRARRFGPPRRISPVAEAHRREVRMYRFERIEHALLVVSFLTLVWTGFSLKYPDQWWARPLVMWESAFPLRGFIHRVAAVILMTVAGMHVVSLIASGRLRRHWKLLWPQRSDVPEALGNFAYRLGLMRTRPYLSPHSYIEKAEYWAVAWGTVIMGITGVMLWANNLTLRFLPKVALDLATAVHFYEAVLATLAIFIWHLYSVIFDPDVYPLETAFLTGVSVKDEDAESAALPDESQEHRSQ